jgi:UDP-glucose/GDP-mannose dehydrogenase family, central domain
MGEIYRPLYLNRSPILYTSRRTAELIKYAANAFLTTKIIFINYFSIGLIMSAAMTVVIASLVHGIWNEQRKAQRPFVKVTESGRAELVGLEGRKLPKSRDYGRTSGFLQSELARAQQGPLRLRERAHALHAH